MAKDEDLARLRQGVDAWNAWRARHTRLVHLGGANLEGAHLSGADLGCANLRYANLRVAKLARANLQGADLEGAVLGYANLEGANLQGANLREAVGLVKAKLGGANLEGADLSRASLRDANLKRAGLGKVNLFGANLEGANLEEANLEGAKLGRANLAGANLRLAKLAGANLEGANLEQANLEEAKLAGTNLGRANLARANLARANLARANLGSALLIEANLTGADLTGCRVYGISAWDLKLEEAKQRDLVITRPKEPEITVDNIEVGQFLYLLLHNEKIRSVIDTIGKKGVLLLGRFSGGRMALLERLREELRGRDFVPIVFNFDRPEKSDFTETVRTLAGLCRFIIADITSPRSTPLELQATVPEYMIPFVPIIEDGEEPFAMFRDLWVKHRAWVLDPIAYGSVEELVAGLDKEIIEPAVARFDELVLKKAERLRIRRMGT